MSDLEFLEVVFASSELPNTPGVYGILSQKDGECLDVGKATQSHERRRYEQYLKNRLG